MVLAMVVNIFIVLVFFITLVNGQTMEEEGREESIKKLQEQMVGRLLVRFRNNNPLDMWDFLD